MKELSPLPLEIEPVKTKYGILSLSGGMDSTCLLVRMIQSDEFKEIHCLSFNYGQKHVKELKCAAKTVAFLQGKFKDKVKIVHKVYNLSKIFSDFKSVLLQNNPNDVPTGHYAEENMKQTVVPNRNMILGSIVSGYALSLIDFFKSRFWRSESVEVFMGVHSGDHTIYPDCRPDFISAFELAVKKGNWDGSKFSVKTPYLELDKAKILKDCLENCEKLNLDFDAVLKNTLTSYSPNRKGESLGLTGSDIERIEAFLHIGRKDPIKYYCGWELAVVEAEKILQNRKSELETRKGGKDGK